MHIYQAVYIMSIYFRSKLYNFNIPEISLFLFLLYFILIVTFFSSLNKISSQKAVFCDNLRLIYYIHYIQKIFIINIYHNETIPENVF